MDYYPLYEAHARASLGTKLEIGEQHALSSKG